MEEKSEKRMYYLRWNLISTNMEKHLLALLIIGLSIPVFAQQEASSHKKLKLIGVSGSMGITYDRYNTMSLNQLTQLAQQPELMMRNLDGLTEEASTQTAGASLFVNMVLSPLQKSTGTYLDNLEFRLGLGLNSTKESMVSYKNADLDTSLVFCNINSEVTLETSYIFSHSINKKLFLYFGVGANSSFSVNNKMMIISGKYFAEGAHPSAQEQAAAISFEAKPILYSRVFIPWGVHFQASDQLSIGLDFRKGRGMQYTAGEKPNMMANTGAIMIGTKFFFH